MERFHDELRQENRGIKRHGLKDSDEHITKRVRSGDNLEIQYIKDDDWEQMSNALKALEGKNNPQEEIFPRKAKWDWAESNEESQDEDSEDDVEMWGRGYKKQEIESDGDIDSNNDSEDNDGDEDNDEYDNQPDDSDDESEGGDDQSDESGDDNDDDNDDDRDDIKYMRGFGDIKFEGDKIYEQADSKLNLDDDDIEIDGDVFKFCGKVYKSGEHTLYWYVI